LRLTYNALAGVIFLLISIPLSIFLINKFLLLKDNPQKYLDSLTKEINNLKPYEWKKIDLELNNNQVLVYNPYYFPVLLNNKQPYNFYLIHYPFSFNCKYVQEKKAYFCENELTQFYSLNSINPNSKLENFLRSSTFYLLKSLVGCNENENNKLANDFMYLLTADINPYLFQTYRFVTNHDCLIKSAIFGAITLQLAKQFKLLSLLKRGASVSVESIAKKEVFKKAVNLIMERLVREVVKKISFTIITTSARVVLKSSIPALGWILSLIDVGFATRDVYEIWQDYQNAKSIIESLLSGDIVGYLVGHIKPYYVSNARLDLFQNYLLVCKVKNKDIKTNCEEFLAKSKLNDNIVAVSSGVALDTHLFYDNAFDRKSYYVVKLPVAEDKYILLFLNETSFNNIKDFLFLLNTGNLKEISQKYNIFVAYDKKLELYLIYDKSNALKKLSDFIPPFYVYLKVKDDNLKKIENFFKKRKITINVNSMTSVVSIIKNYNYIFINYSEFNKRINGYLEQFGNIGKDCGQFNLDYNFYFSVLASFLKSKNDIEKEDLSNLAEFQLTKYLILYSLITKKDIKESAKDLKYFLALSYTHSKEIIKITDNLMSKCKIENRTS